MAEASALRLVRCPKCRNLLQELPDYSVYECGGCGAVLRGTKKVSTNDGFLRNSENGQNGGGLGSLSEAERESDGLGVCAEKEDRVFVQGNVDLVSVSSSRSEDKEFLIGNDDVNVGENHKGSRLAQNSFEREIRYVDNSRLSSNPPIDVRVGGDDQDMNLNGSKSVNSSVAKGTGEVSGQVKNSAKFMKARAMMNRWGLESEEFPGYDRGPREIAEHSTFSPLAYSDEGSSNYKPNSLYGHGKPIKNFGFPDDPNGVGNLGLNRAELHRKLHYLKEQISRLEEKPRERILDDRKMTPSESDRDSIAYSDSMQTFAQHNCPLKPHNSSFSHGPAPVKNDHNMDRRNFYPSPRYVPNIIPGSNYEDPFWSQMLRRPLNQLPPQYTQLPLNCCSGRCMDFDQKFLAAYLEEPFLRQPACSCSLCCNKNWQIPPEVSGTNFSNRRSVKEPTGSNFYKHVSPVKFPMNHEPLVAIPPPLHSQGPQLHARWPIDMDSDVDGFLQSRPRRVVIARGNRRLSYPLAGGAPFMICRNCSELLKLPRKDMKMENSLKKLQCGTCSTFYSYEIKNKRLKLSVSAETEKVSCEADDGSRDLLNGGNLSSLGCSTAGGTNSCSIAFDSNNNFQTANTKRNVPIEDQMFNLSVSPKRPGHPSSTSISKEEEKSLDSVFVQRDVSNSSELPSKDDMPQTEGGLSFNDHFDDSASNHAASSSEIESRSRRTDQERVTLDKITSQQNAENDTSMENEVEVSINEYLNANLSHNAVEASKEDQLKIRRGHKTFWMGVIKRSFRDFSRSTQSTKNGRPNVSVNGQQIPERLIKKAEKLAGPIEPGDYWYDFRAGFWGVMGQTCLGIITPYIEEFNYPIPENCAAGNTGVYVNGRELHQIDFDLLVSRGLPATRNKKYIVEFSGRILDEDSGKELDCLGKLAPTVEKVKRGFGMRAPKVAS